jgi:hypothetical protein
MMNNPILPIVLGLGLLVFSRQALTRAREQHSRRLSQLESGESERFHEERRSLVAYPPPKSVWTFRVLGLLLVAGGIFEFVIR